MREDKDRRRIEKATHECIYGPVAQATVIPRYCEDDEALRAAMREAEMRFGLRTVEEKGPSTGESYHTSLKVRGLAFPGSGSSDVEARAQAVATMLVQMRLRPIEHLPEARRLAKQHGLTLERCLCREGVFDRKDADSATGESPTVPCPHCEGRAKVWWSPDRKLVAGFSDEDMIQQVARHAGENVAIAAP